MSRAPGVSRAARRLSLLLVVTVGLLTATGGAAFAAPLTDLTSESFTGSTTADAGWVLPSAGTNNACLTAGTSTTQQPIPACTSTAIDPDGSGVLRLSDNGGDRVGTVYNTTSLPTAQGLDVRFDTYQWNGTGADGISFILAATNPRNPEPPATTGPLGGSLGYSATLPATPGVSYGYLGFGLDVFGNFEASGWGGTDCPASAKTPQSITVRGPGDGTTGYCVLSSATVSEGLDSRSAVTRPAPVPVEIALNPAASPATTPSGVSVPANSWLMQVTSTTGVVHTMTGALPTGATLSGYGYPGGWYDSTTGLPYQLTFGWAASTGGSNEIHEINRLTTSTLNGQLPSYSLALSDDESGQLIAGNRATVLVTPSLDLAQGAESQPVTVSATLPAGLTPSDPSSVDYACTTTGQQVECTYTPSSAVPAGSSLPTLRIPVSVSSSAQGSATITAKVSSNDGKPATADPHTVTFTSLSASASPTSLVYGAADTLTLSGLPGNATGTISFSTPDSTLCTATLPATSCDTAADLDVGPYPVAAHYSGDTAYAAQSVSTSFDVTKAATTVAASAAPASVAFGNPDTLTVSGVPVGATGTVAFTSGGATLCTATLPATSCSTGTSLDVGTYPVTATYSGDANHAGDSDTTSFEVTQAATALTASVSDPTVEYGTTDTLSATGIPGGASGTVAFTSGGATLCSATLPATSCSTSTSLDVGTYPVTATYSGDGNHAGDSDVTSFEVTKAATTLTAGASAATITYGASETLTHAGLPAGATGTVEFAADGATLCTATLPDTSCTTAPAPPAGTYTVTATYSGDSHYTGDTDSTTFTVAKAGASGFVAAATPASTTYGTADTLSFTGLPTAATGSVTFTSGGSTLCTATLPDASCSAPADLDVDTYAVDATYSGDDNHDGSTASTSFTVTSAPTSLVASAGAPSVTYGTSQTLSYSGLPADASGTVAFRSGATQLCTASLPDTSCSAPAGLDVGTYPVTATYSGDHNHDGSTAATSFTVATAATTVQAVVSSQQVTYGTAQTLAYAGLPANAQGTVTFTAGGSTLCTAKLPQTSCTAASGLGAGTYPVTATYSGDGNHDGSSDSATFTIGTAPSAMTARVSDPKVTVGTPVVLTAAGLAASATGAITFTAAGTTLCTASLPIASCSSSAMLAAGDYQVTATYAGDANHAATTASTDFAVMAIQQTVATTVTVGGTSSSTAVPGAGSASSVRVTGQPQHGSATIVDGRLVYTPRTGFVGTDTITVRVVDADGAVTVLTITERVTAPTPQAAPATVGWPAAPAVAAVIGRLPRTGFGVLAPVLVGVVLVVAGGSTLWLGRRKAV